MYNKKTDDELDVFAFQRAQMAENVKDTIDLIEELQKQEDSLAEIRQDCDQIRKQLSALGVPLELLERTKVAPEATDPVVFPKIQLPADIDYRQEYQKLVNAAHKKGFVNTRPEQLLTKKEMEQAIARSQHLDKELSRITALNLTDIGVITIGVALHILRNVLCSNRLQDEKSITPESIEDHRVTDGLDKSAEILRIIPFKRAVGIKSPDEILSGVPSFQNVSDNRFPSKEDFLGIHPVWGWIVGVFNIITDTVTVRDFHTFKPERAADSSVYALSEQYLPFKDLFVPFIDHGISGLEENLIAATIREAYVLIPHQIQYNNISQVFERNKRLFTTATSTTQGITSVLSLNTINDALMSAGWANLINTMLIAIHGLFYKDDCDQKQYLARTMKVITTANLIGTTMCSLTAIAAERWDLVDYAGVLTSALNVANLTNLLIDVKTEFLKSHYIPRLQQQLINLDEYFE